MNSPTDLAKMVPGFEFLQTMMKSASAGIPGMGQWIAPTLDPAELEKRIKELRTVQFWLEQNARLLGTTIQAMEVQRMTLSTLQSMNLPMTDLRDSLLAVMPQTVPPADDDANVEEDDQEDDAEEADAAAAASAATAPAAAPRAAPAIDPMQWWTALTQQFGELAANAIKNPADPHMQPAFTSPPPSRAEPAVAAPRRKPATRPGTKTTARAAPPKRRA